jgi:hypothetical protein
MRILAIAVVLSLCAGCREHRALGSDRKTVEVAEAGETITPVERARRRLAEASCERARRCDRDASAESLEACAERVTAAGLAGIDEHGCSAVDERAVTTCAFEVRLVDCNQPLDNLTTVEACHSSRLCE